MVQLPTATIKIPRRQWQYFDWPLFALVIITTMAGLATLYGTTWRVPRLDYLPARQAVWWALGLVAMMATLLIDGRMLRRLTMPLYAICVGLLILTLLKSDSVKGAERWLSIGGVRFQPSEFTKIAIVLVTARELMHLNLAGLRGTQLLKALSRLGLLIAVPAGLIIIQPDLGTSLVLVPTVVAMLIVAGMTPRYLIIGIVILALAGAAAYPLLKDYQKRRILVHFNPEIDARRSGYNIIQAKIALGSGGLTGRGWGEGTQTSLGFLPEHHADFIFNSFGEQFGLIGGITLISLYLAIFLRCLRLAALARDVHAAYTIVGLAAVFGVHVSFNILIGLHVLPVTGLPLPFFSAGGSALLASYLIFGIILSLGMRRHHFHD